MEKDLKEIKFPQPITYEPTVSNSFILKFPTEMGIQSWIVKSVSAPKFIDGKWDNTIVSLKNINDEIAPPPRGARKLLWEKNFNITIEFLNAHGVTLQKWLIEIEKVISIDFGGILSYEKDEINTIDIVMKTKNCKF